MNDFILETVTWFFCFGCLQNKWEACPSCLGESSCYTDSTFGLLDCKKERDSKRGGLNKKKRDQTEDFRKEQRHLVAFFHFKLVRRIWDDQDFENMTCCLYKPVFGCCASQGIVKICFFTFLHENCNKRRKTNKNKSKWGKKVFFGLAPKCWSGFLFFQWLFLGH